MSIYMPEPTELKTGGAQGYLRIATEEAWWPREIFDAYRGIIDSGNGGEGFRSLIGHYITSDSARAKFITSRLGDTGAVRLSDMDAAGIDHAVLALTAPGTQVLEPHDAAAIARIANDRLADACAANPRRFSGLAAVGFEDVDAGLKELERGITDLGLKGLICNSHFRGHYLSEQEYWPYFEALEALDVPLYLHPNTPNDSMVGTFREAGLDGAIFGFGVETALHLLKIITSGALDRFPKLRIVVGHLGEALPFWLYRFDYMHAGQVAAKRYPAIGPLELTISEYMQRNVWVTTSGMPWWPTIEYTRKVLGNDRVMYAMDYPYEYAPDEVRMQDQMPLAPEEKREFFQDIAVRAFGLDRDVIGAV